MIGVYKLKFPKGHYYIGSSVDIDARLKHHKSQIISGGHTKRILDAVGNNGEDIELEILHECVDDVDIRSLEKEEIEKAISTEKNLDLILNQEAASNPNQTDVFVRFRLSDEEYAEAVSAITDHAKETGKLLTIHNYCKEVVLEVIRKD